MKLFEIKETRWHFMYILQVQNSAASITSLYDGDLEVAKKLKSRVRPALSNDDIKKLMKAAELSLVIEWKHIFRHPTGVAFFFSIEKDGVAGDISERFGRQIQYELPRMKKQFYASTWMQDDTEGRAKFVKLHSPVENITKQIL